MRYLVTGPTGFIGRRLISRLMAAGDVVYAVARRNDHGLSCTTHISNDALDVSLYETIMRSHDIDVVINVLGAGVNPKDRDPAPLLAANAIFPAKLAGVAAKAGVSAFVHIGSGSEYAPAKTDRPFTESSPLEDARLYGATKSAGSLLVRSFAEAAGLPVAVLRAFNIFGPGENEYRLFPAAVKTLSKGSPMDLSIGTQVKDFLYVDDACDAIRRMAQVLVAGKAVSGCYNLASGESLTVAKFVMTLAKVMGADPQLLRFGALPLRPDEVPYLVGDTAKLNAVIGPASTRNLYDSLREGCRELGGAICTDDENILTAT